MKKLALLILFLSFGFSQSLSAQFGLSISSGLNNSNVIFEGTEDPISTYRVGYFVNVAPSYIFNDRFKFNLNTQFSQKGYSNEVQGGNSIDFRYSYLDLIPEFDYRITNFLAIGIGVNTGFSLNEEFNLDGNGWNENEIGSIKPFDFGATAKIEFNFKNIFIFTRYNYGLINISELNFTDANGSPQEVKQINTNLQFGLGYTFNFNKS